MNLIGIDISIDSTAMTIFRNEDMLLFNFTTMKRGVNWIKRIMEYVDIEFIDYTYKDIDNYTEKEISKLREYDHVTNLIFNKIIGNIDKNEKSIAVIEGYNYGLKSTNVIIDIVTFSTLLRKKLLEIPNIEQIIIVSPKTVKSLACEMAYGYTLTKSGKKIINTNKNGVSGGKFDKKDMLEAFLKINYTNKLSELIHKFEEELLKLKNVPKPMDDIIDSALLVETLRETFI